MFADPSLGPFDPAQTTQLHDANPGDLNEQGLPNHFPDGGVFWTREVPEDSVDVKGGGKADFTLIGFTLLDYLNVANAVLRNGPDPTPAMASLDAHWRGTGEKTRVRNRDGGFIGRYHRSTVELDWHLSNAEGYFLSTSSSHDIHVTSAFTAKLRNGIYAFD